MSKTTRIPKAEITGLSGYLVKRFSRKMLGEVPDGAAVMWHNRPVLMSLMRMGQKVQKWNEADPNLKSFAHMAAAARIGCSFCLDFGYFQAHNEGLDVAKASEVPRWRESTVFTPLERDVMEYAEAMTQTPPQVTDELSARSPAVRIEIGGALDTAVSLGVENGRITRIYAVRNPRWLAHLDGVAPLSRT